MGRSIGSSGYGPCCISADSFALFKSICQGVLPSDDTPADYRFLDSIIYGNTPSNNGGV